MRSPKHTPEPWILHSNGHITTPDHTPIGLVFDNVDPWDAPLGEEPSVYNGALIREAPALLRKAKEIVSRGYLDGELLAIIERAEKIEPMK